MKVEIFGIKFENISRIKLLNPLNFNGLLTFPAAPALVNIYKDKKYYLSLKNSDYVFFDSGYLCLILKIMKNIHVNKLSGLLFLKKLIRNLKNSKFKVLLIDPNSESSKKNEYFFKKKLIKNLYNYIAPKYNDNFDDKILLKKIKKIDPKFVIINLGGGVQEKLGLYLKKNTKKNITIICTGAAIAFLTGDQARIPHFIDKLYLGWLFRIIFNPRLYFFRYLNSFKLLFMVNNTKVKVYGKK
jgi:exopolysaccharide biosynthesis WecB/TagA/CpsF family protein